MFKKLLLFLLLIAPIARFQAENISTPEIIINTAILDTNKPAIMSLPTVRQGDKLTLKVSWTGPGKIIGTIVPFEFQGVQSRLLVSDVFKPTSRGPTWITLVDAHCGVDQWGSVVIETPFLFPPGVEYHIVFIETAN